jgi:prefoldin alpha subunit
MATPLTISNEREIQPYQLSIEQLQSLKTQHEEELQELQRQMESLIGAKSRFINAKNSLLDIATSSNETKIMIPLNASLYVPGKIVDSGKVSPLFRISFISDTSLRKSLMHILGDS